MSNQLYLTSSTLQTSIASLLVDNFYVRDFITKYYVPDMFRYYDTEIYTSYRDEVQNDYISADQMNKTIFNLFPPSKIDNDLYFNTNNILDQLVGFVKKIEKANEIFTTGVTTSCTQYHVPWEGTYFVYNNEEKPYSVLTVQDYPLNFYDQCLYYQESFSLYTAQQMMADYESFNPLNSYFVPQSFIGYILQRAMYVQNQILTFCEQVLAQRQGYLPSQYVSFWNIPEKAKIYVEQYNPSYFYGNQFVFPSN